MTEPLSWLTDEEALALIEYHQAVLDMRAKTTTLTSRQFALKRIPELAALLHTRGVDPRHSF